MIGIILLGYDYFASKKDYVYEEMNFALSGIPDEIEENPPVEDGLLSDTEEVIEQITTEQIDNTENNDPTPSKPNYNYIGYLEIPKISFKKGFVSINSRDNNVNKNIALMEGSQYPNTLNSLMVIAAHNGTCWNCYFRNLNKLSKGDFIYIYYDNVLYTYKLVNIYEVNKTGSVAIYRDNLKTTLALVTCTWGTKTKQSVFIAELTYKENI